MQTATSRALVTIFRTMQKTDQKAFFEWIKKHEKEIETDTLGNDLEEREDFLKLSALGLSRAYGNDEPECSLKDCVN